MNAYHVFGILGIILSIALGLDNNIVAPGLAVAAGLCVLAGALVHEKGDED